MHTSQQKTAKRSDRTVTLKDKLTAQNLRTLELMMVEFNAEL